MLSRRKGVLKTICKLKILTDLQKKKFFNKKEKELAN